MSLLPRPRHVGCHMLSRRAALSVRKIRNGSGPSHVPRGRRKKRAVPCAVPCAPTCPANFCIDIQRRRIGRLVQGGSISSRRRHQPTRSACATTGCDDAREEIVTGVRLSFPMRPAQPAPSPCAPSRSDAATRSAYRSDTLPQALGTPPEPLFRWTTVGLVVSQCGTEMYPACRLVSRSRPDRVPEQSSEGCDVPESAGWSCSGPRSSHYRARDGT